MVGSLSEAVIGCPWCMMRIGSPLSRVYVAVPAQPLKPGLGKYRLYRIRAPRADNRSTCDRGSHDLVEVRAVVADVADPATLSCPPSQPAA